MSRKLDIIALMFEIDVRPHPTVKVAVGLSKFVPVFKVILFLASSPETTFCALVFTVGPVDRIRSPTTPRRDLLSSTGRHGKTQNRFNCRSKEQFSFE